MSPGVPRERDRALALLADRATEGLCLGDEHALSELLSRNPEIDPDCLDRVAAAALLSWMGRPSEALPGVVRQRVERQAHHLNRSPGGHGRR